MAKGNLFLGHAAGKVGDVVFSRVDGVQVTRARNRSPKNPQSGLQQLQRVVLKTSSAAYSLMRSICDHSFQGLQVGTPNQSRFSSVNVANMRARLAEVINSGDLEVILSSTEANYAPKGSTLAPINPYIVSEGTIPSLILSMHGSGTAASSWYPQIHVSYTGLPETSPTDEDVTYQMLVDALGLQRGDQLTLVWLSTDDSDSSVDAGYFNRFHVDRIILEPANGDMSTQFASINPSGPGLIINSPNPRNDFTARLSSMGVSDGYLQFQPGKIGLTATSGHNNTLCGFACIVSRLTGSVWQRSREVLTIRPSDGTTVGTLKYDTNVLLLGDAIRSYLTEANSLLYLNQAR